MTTKRINVIDMACEEYSQEVLGFSDVIASGNPTPYYDPIISTTSLKLTPFGNSDFLLEEVDAFFALEDDPTSPEVDQSYLDFEGDIILLEAFLNDDQSLPPPNQGNYLPEVRKELKIYEAKSDKSSIDEPPEVELKDLPPHLEYAFLSEKTTFPCPYGMFAYHCMPFGLCNAPGIFQRCMMAIFHDMIEKTMEVFMDDISVFKNSFQSCLSHLERMLKRCEDTNLCLNWEKSHFMIKEGIVLGHKISKQRIEVDNAKVDVITKLPHPTTVKECVEAFQTLKRKLTEAPILIAPEWDMPFELMCDAGDFAIGAVLGQHQDKHFRPIHYTRDENLAGDHLSRLENPHQNVLDPKDINESFPLETLNLVSTRACKSHAKVWCHSLFSNPVSPLNKWPGGGLKLWYKRILERTVGENRASWSDKLDDALWSFRTAYKTPIGCTPYKLVYVKACYLLIELKHKAYWTLKHANFDLQTVGDHKKVKLNELRDQVNENSLIYMEKTKRLHDFKIKDRVFNISDRVLLFNSRLKIFSGKLKSRWSGLFTISHVYPYGTVELAQLDGPNFKVNGHRLKHYFREDVPKLVVPNLQTFLKDH
nr:reverse transcriptase domain-containing protein [Tanacetum cinerariifolium]